MKHKQRPAETLEADVVAEAREIGSELMPGFVPTAEIRFLEKNEFVELLAKDLPDYKDRAYRDFVKYGAVGLFDPASDTAFVTFTERRPSYRAALVGAVHEMEGHAYMGSMRARKEECALAEKALRQYQKAVAVPVGEKREETTFFREPSKKITYCGARGAVNMLELEKADEVFSMDDLLKLAMAREVVQFFDEGFAYWTSVKAMERVKSDKKCFGKYGQTRIDAWSPLDGDSSDVGEESESERYRNGRYRHNSWNGLAFYSEIEKRFGEAAVPLAAKACLDVPLNELVDTETAGLYFINLASDNYDLAGRIADKATSNYAARKLAELSAVLKPVENEGYNRSLLAKLVEKGEDSFFGPKEPASEPKNSGFPSKAGFKLKD